MTGSSIDIQLDQLEKLKQLFPESIKEGKIDWEKLQSTLGKENFVFQNERYVLSAKSLKVIALDRLFAGNDLLKTNAVLQMKDAGIDFKTI